MDLTEAEDLARSLMLKHDLGHLEFKFDRAVKAAGQTWFKATGSFYGPSHYPFKITLSRVRTEAGSPTFVRNVILHEIAHALTPGHHHDRVWQKKLLSIGGNGQRCYSEGEAETQAAPMQKAWEGRCRNGHLTSAYRHPQRVKSCGQCSSRWSHTAILYWFRVDGKQGSVPQSWTLEFDRLKLKYPAL